MRVNNSNRAAAKAVNILAVDDSADALELIKRHLESIGHTVITATNVDLSLIHI